jgi:heme exporter protein B
MNGVTMASKLWWLIHKDLVVEYRTRQAWPAMLLLGIIVAVVFNLQMELLPEQRPAAAGALLWLATLFAGLVAIERTCAAEQQDGCWEGLVLYPLPPSMIYLAKLAVNFIALLALQCVLVPLFVVLADVPLLQNAWAMVLVAVLGSLGMAAVGTLVSAVTHGLRQRAAVLSLLALPLLLPLVLAAAKATQLVAEGDLGEQWWRWVQFLGAFAIIFTTLGIVLFGFLVEE